MQTQAKTKANTSKHKGKQASTGKNKQRGRQTQAKTKANTSNNKANASENKRKH
jgi:hypothetical protein